MVQAEEALRQQGARRAFAAGVHPVLSGPALDRNRVRDEKHLEAAVARCPRIRPLSIAPLLGEAIQRIHEGASVSSLFV
jgi:ribose-phosphate pyrophosphokinase